ncbi:hypothetical protein CPB86DRAFT_702792 [Serendipita vermifera]|nr:hypothetical protein CPB86DRAFT_702792 [Serendipita vermifera]
MRKESGNEKLITVYEAAHGEKTAREIFILNMSRACVLFFTDPCCMVIGLYMAVICDSIYLLFVTFGYIFTVNYHQSLEIASLHYIAPGLGQFIGSIIAGISVDRIYVKLTAKNGGEGKPEYRVPVMIASAIFIAVGLFIYGWCGEYHKHWISLDIGVRIGTVLSFLSLNTYILDAFKYAASAVAATTVIRSIAGALFPLFGQAMFDKMGLGWGNSLLGFIALFTGIGFPVFLWVYGPAIRAKGNSER